MAFVDDADVQVHLPYDKLKVEGIPDDRFKVYLDSERIVRGYLAGIVDTAVLASWSTPLLTPETIRAITGRFAAAFIYRTRYSENRLGNPEYAQNLYNEAMALLMDVIGGNVPIDDVVIGSEFDNTWFEPNNSSNDPKFAMDDRY